MRFEPKLHRTRHTVANTTLVRRQNALALFQAFAERTLASGGSPKGMEQAFAATLQISPSMWSQIKSSRPIGDKLARQIEHLGGKGKGWLDEERDSGALTPAEQAWLDLALASWRASNGAGRKLLRAHLAGVLDAIASQAANETSTLRASAEGRAAMNARRRSA
jgi:hypothetical protein